ncbi:hypothetical protein [Streptomyces longwoodensis]|uniref:hypothetical protein n=1 Tax=Streptomyces longwoodensis TaxID=68231 RepID=UPI00224DA623|nr:hypothetical protein [Streptomyces longwoodensis]MCX4999210.1 hypothetical protein [Streptomyces longwoodensis]
MRSPALTAALADIDTVFNGFASPTETGCGLCHLPEETAHLRSPYTRVPPDVLNMYLFEVPDHFDDHAAAMRRLLPQGARAMADGTLDGFGWGFHGLSRAEWRSWPAEQADAVEALVTAWWADVVRSPHPPYPVEDVFETCAAILRDVGPLLDRWERGPVADAHLVAALRSWLAELLEDQSPFTWIPHAEDELLAVLRSWTAADAPARLRALGESDLANRAGLLALSYDDRWAHPYWRTASVTN